MMIMSKLADEEDDLSKFPDEIVASIMCWLDTEEAARMSVVSKRLRKIWKSTIQNTPRLAFNVDYKFAKKLSAAHNDRLTLKFENDDDDSDLIRRYSSIINEMKVRDLMRDKIINEVNGVLELHKAPTLDEFSLFGDRLIRKQRHHINTWVHFAAKKHVKKLTLHLNTAIRYDATFIADKFHCLRDLYIKGLYVTQNVIRSLFSNCPFLERFSLLHSYKFDKLKIISAPNLKYLHLSDNWNLRQFKFSSAKNVLDTIEIGGGQYPLLTIDVSAPNLSHLNLAIHHCFKFDPYLTLLNQIKRLALRIGSDRSLLQFPQFSKVDHLELILSSSYQIPIHLLPDFLKTAPLLNTLSIKFCRLRHPAKDNCLKWLGKHIVEKVEVNHSCQYIKVVKLDDFAGCQDEIEFLLNLLYTVSVEKIIIQLMPFTVWRNRKTWWCYEDEFDNLYEEFCQGSGQLLKMKILQMHPNADVTVKL
ncbi:putative F-box/LRR-repeat protein At3g28410 [Ziziphus jujuba]|uniref:F-box/LRR-repeat protein At3g28410 n=3 Tax=Ziziphus jujuba TaxID=326968 RepID=A0A6P6FWI4_ZIZJJ|nr:putative F-box/LRR-repeat protein At3g28410 [Ziziphus jujuba]XP_015875293.3 putative F-box/LRR-repeat protein At3g28410 [Ziziphus jujuba]